MKQELLYSDKFWIRCVFIEMALHTSATSTHVIPGTN